MKVFSNGCPVIALILKRERVIGGDESTMAERVCKIILCTL